MLILYILNHPCSCMVYYYLFGVFFILANYYFEVSFNLKVILYVAKITQNTVTELL